MKKAKRITELAVPALTVTGLITSAEYLYRYAFKRVPEVPPTSADKQKYADQYYAYVDWLHQQPTQEWYLNEDTAYQLVATYVPAEQATTKAVIIAHGYKGNGETMANYAKMFHEMGYNVLLPDSRAHGHSAGKYITFGWLDRFDYLRWVDDLIKRLGQHSQIVLFGVSMGGATVEMMSGEEMPSQVKCIIADCGYSDIDDELSYLLKRTFHLPKYPLVPAVSFINWRRQGFRLKQVSSVKQLRKNKRPIFFIHGEKDVYVPTAMLNDNYAATQGPKEKWIVPDASHAESFWIDPAAYRTHVAAFLNRYIENPS
ncbi:cell surface hydrolase, membrane-bound [Lactobacillus selangorensis]|uniref:Cell surface hydrolase, membrane-bound n=1 Tax=Lactobacillus selangorensis TaxID=81857 RepID=A0A0R2FJK0_9LACO|nr:alpha/beta hydrolase [Lactobacillus selangorensis]KRN28833.1 cell surface hydrolase, membrane-bound [Lactobacillus selangorensis]KRN32757.1 cell surface hydrolase, membrane-bound [Lactobacillus selangorensis]